MNRWENQKVVIQNKPKCMAIVFSVVLAFALAMSIIGVNAFANTNDNQEATNADTTIQNETKTQDRVKEKSGHNVDLSQKVLNEAQVAAPIVSDKAEANDDYVCELYVEGEENPRQYEYFNDVEEDISKLPSGSVATLKLLDDVYPYQWFKVGYDSSLKPNKIDLTIDLNGHVFSGEDVSQVKYSENQYAIGSTISMSYLATLSIKDSSEDKTGKITGGPGCWEYNYDDTLQQLDYYGSGICNWGGTLNIESGTITDCNLQFNYEQFSPKEIDYVCVYGSAVYCVPWYEDTMVSKPTLNITGGTITGNSVTMRNKSSLKGDFECGMYGGGIDVVSAEKVTINNATISNNTINTYNENKDAVTLYAYGAGLSLYDCANSENVISNVEISNNSFVTNGYDLSDRDNVDVGGAGIFINSSNVALNTVDINSNSGAIFGGGLHSFSSKDTYSNYTINLNNVSITNNTAKAGGGVYLGGYTSYEEAYTTCNFNSGKISNNNAIAEDFDLMDDGYSTAAGGGVCCYSGAIRTRFNINGGSISNNTVRATASSDSGFTGTKAYGGGVYMHSCESDMIYGEIYKNDVYATTQSKSGSATTSGGGIYCDDTYLRLYNSEVHDNNLTSTNDGSSNEDKSSCTTIGGGISVGQKQYSGYHSCELTESSIYNNTANAVSENNEAVVYGAGITNMYGESLRVSNSCTIKNNQGNAKTSSSRHTAYAFGGGIENFGGDSSIYDSSTLIVNSATISNNKLSASNTKSTKDNSACCYGAGIDVRSIQKGYAALYVEGSVIENNEMTTKTIKSGLKVGGGIYTNRTALLNNSTIQNNSADYGGGIYYVNEQAIPLYLYNDKIINNTSYGSIKDNKYYQGGAGVYAYAPEDEIVEQQSALVVLGGEMYINNNKNVNTTGKTTETSNSNLILEDIDGKTKLLSFDEEVPISDASLVHLEILFNKDEYEVDLPFVFSDSAGKDVLDNFVYDGKEYLGITDNFELKLGEGMVVNSEYFIASSINLNSGIDVAGGSLDSQANVQLYGCNNTGAQRFKFEVADDNYYYIKNTQSGKYLDVCYAQTTNGTNIWQYDQNFTNAQKFKIVKKVSNDSTYPTYVFKSALNENMAIDVTWANTSDCTNIQLYEVNGTNAQSFYILDYNPNVVGSNVDININKNYYISLSADKNAVVDVENASTDNGANVRVYHLTKGDKNLMYKFEPVVVGSKTYYRLINQNSNKSLCAAQGLISPKTNVIQWQNEDTNDQLWSIRQNEDSTLTFINVANGMVMDYEGGNTADYTNIWTYLANGTNAQKFNLIPESDNYDVVFDKGQGILDITDTEGKSLGETVQVKKGSNLSFKVSPFTNWEVDSVYANDKELTPKDGVYTITDVSTDVFVTVKAKQCGGNLTFTALENNAQINVKFETGEWKYSTNGVNWLDGDIAGTTITLANVGDSVQLKGKDCSTSEENHISITNKKVAASGTVQSLDDYSDTAKNHQWEFMFSKSTTLVTPPALTASKLSYACYQSMFENCTSLLYASQLPATQLADYCYYNMFSNCLALTTTSELPATNLANCCYHSMFAGCINLTKVFELPALTLQGGCYAYMFSGCTSLVNAPELPAVRTASYCYAYMFKNCARLTDAPELPSKALSPYCYAYMFENSGLTETPDLPAYTVAYASYKGMFASCNSLVYVNELPALILNENCYENMFYHCISLKVAPELPATNLAEYCYYGMFEECINLVYTPELPAENLASYCYDSMFKYTGLSEAPKLPITDLKEGCYQGMFYGSSLVIAPELPATKLPKYCYQDMFMDCFKLIAVPSFDAEELSENSCSAMFYNCISLVSVPNLKAKTLKEYCYSFMFRNCDSLVDAPTIEAQKLADYACSGMYYDCDSLANVPALTAVTLNYSCYSNMFYHCDSLINPPAIDAVNLADYACYQMFTSCSSLSSTPALKGVEPPAGNTCESCYYEMFAGCTSLTQIAPIDLKIEQEQRGQHQFERMFAGCSSLYVEQGDTKKANTFLQISDSDPQYIDDFYKEMFTGTKTPITLVGNKYLSWVAQ